MLVGLAVGLAGIGNGFVCNALVTIHLHMNSFIPLGSIMKCNDQIGTTTSLSCGTISHRVDIANIKNFRIQMCSHMVFHMIAEVLCTMERMECIVLLLENLQWYQRYVHSSKFPTCKS